MSNRAIQKEARAVSGKERAVSEHAFPEPEPYDAIIIGTGLCGIIFLAYARERGLRCIALEKQNDVGGLWNRLPSWQDLQNRRQDIALDGVPLHKGPASP